MADPIQGLIDFVLAQKPYHTKILDTLVNYVHEDEVAVDFTESQLFEIGVIIEAELSDESGTPDSVVQTCPLGFGDTWDQQGQFLVVWVDTVPVNDVVYVKGDQTTSFTAGVVFEVRNPDPTFQATAPLTVLNSAYDGPTDRTAVIISGAFPGIPWVIPGAAPGDNDDTAGDVFIIYSVISTTIIGNIIVVNGVGINIDDFQPGFAVDIRNNTNVALNKGYRIVAAVETVPGSEVTILSTTTVSVNSGFDALTNLQDETDYDGAGSNGTFVGGDGVGGTAYVVLDTIKLSDGSIVTVDAIDVNDDVTQFTITAASNGKVSLPVTLVQVASATGVGFSLTLGTANVTTFPAPDGELVFSGFGYDEPPFCASSEDTLVQPVIGETLDIQTLQEPGAVASYQYFILEADAGANTFVVAGDARSDLAPAVTADVIQAIDNWATIVTVPTINGGVLNNGYGATLNGNDVNIKGSSYTVTSTSYDPITDRSTVLMDNVPVSLRTGWIIPT